MSRRLVLFVFLLLLAAKPYSPSANRLFTLGTITIENVTKAHMLSHDHASFGATTFDDNGDGWPDLLVSNHGQPPTLFLNHQGGPFVPAPEIFKAKGFDHHTPVTGDFDNDGDQDLYFLLGAHLGTGTKENEFYVNPGRGKPFVLTQNAGIIDPKGRGRGAVWFDYDWDGLIDLYVLNKYRADASNRLYHNNGDGTFSDVTVQSGLNQYIDSEGGAVAGDIDNDGDMDLMVTSLDHGPYLFINRGDGTFEDQTVQRGIAGRVVRTWGIGAADVNNDGFLDLYFTGGSQPRIEGALLSGDRISFMQSVFSSRDPVDRLSFAGAPNVVLNFQFADDSADVDHLYIGANSYNPHSLDFIVGPGHISAIGEPSLWKENGSQKGTFIWKDSSSGRWNVAAASGSFAQFWSGALVLAGSNLSDLQMAEMEPQQARFDSLFYLNKGDGTFRNATTEAHLANSYNSRSATWADFDNDSDLDLFVVDAGFNGPGKQPNVCFTNEGGRFERFEVPMGVHEQFAIGDCGVSFDFNRDGTMDLFVINGGGRLPGSFGPYQLFQNRTQNNNNWIAFRLQGAGRDYTNRDGVGAKVRLTSTDGKIQWRHVLGGSGSDCQSARPLHFGLGASNGLDIEVFWPSSHTYPQGHTQTFTFSSAQLNQRYVIHEVKGIL